MGCYGCIITPSLAVLKNAAQAIALAILSNAERLPLRLPTG